MPRGKESSWRIHPVEISVLKALDKRDGVLLDSELTRLLEKEIPNLSDSELNESLMSLEIKGLIHVIEIKKNTRRISKIEEMHSFLPIGED
ncbi:MAG: hypothetical protein ACFFDT_02500 [Candidatus Hodarchaeota archaeon]